MLTDNALEDVTGQAGVSIAVDDIQLFLNIGKIAYIDCDGFDSMSGYGTCSGRAAAVGLNNFQIDVVNINAIVEGDDAGTTTAGMNLSSTSCGLIDLFYNYATLGAPNCTIYTPGDTSASTFGLDNYYSAEANALGIQFVPKVLTIDVTGALPTATDGFRYLYGNLNTAITALGMSFGGVLIGLPTVEIYINEMVMTPTLDADVNGSVTLVYNEDDQPSPLTGNIADYGTIYMKGITFTVLSGWLEIAPH